METHEILERIRRVVKWGAERTDRCVWPVRLDDRFQGRDAASARAQILTWCEENCSDRFIDTSDRHDGWGMRFENPCDLSMLVMAEEEGKI